MVPGENLKKITTLFEKEKQLSYIKALMEQRMMVRDYPPKWKGDIRSNGRQLAIYDTVQPHRNTLYVNAVNKKEQIYILSSFKHKKDEDSIQCVIDVYELLNREEVLNFTFDDFNDNFSTIMVQSKSLFIYQIDFTTSEVVSRVGDYGHNIVMRSIFHTENLMKSGDHMEIKQFIQHQEGLGHKVLLPKLNTDIILVNLKDSSVIKVYSIKLRTFVREFTLSL
jgi:hypothetical protein